MQIKADRTDREIRPKPRAKARQKDVAPRWTAQFANANLAPGGTEGPHTTIPSFGSKVHIPIHRQQGIIPGRAATDAAAHDGARLRASQIDPHNTASGVRADIAYCSKLNDDYPRDFGKICRIHMTKPKGKPMSKSTCWANARNSTLRVRVEHPFVPLKGSMRLMVPTSAWHALKA